MAKVAIITGANGGIGSELTKSLALEGYEVVMACRDLKKSLPVWEEIVKETQKDVQLMHLDLGSLESIKSFVAEIKQKYSSIDLLINNAGVIPIRSKKTDYGIDYCIGVNYVSPYMLTHLLIPHMNIGARIVNVTSIVYKYGKIGKDFFNPVHHQLFHKLKVYTDSKLALFLFTLDMSDFCMSKGITINCCEPGIVNTPILKMGNRFIDFLAQILFTPFIRTPQQGAATALYLALDENIQDSGNLYYNQKPHKVSEKVLQGSERLILRKRTEELISTLPIEI